MVQPVGERVISTPRRSCAASRRRRNELNEPMHKCFWDYSTGDGLFISICTQGYVVRGSYFWKGVTCADCLRIAGRTMPLPSPVVGKNPAAVALGHLGGLKGGPARAAKLTADQLSEIGKKGAAARWPRP